MFGATIYGVEYIGVKGAVKLLGEKWKVSGLRGLERPDGAELAV